MGLADHLFVITRIIISLMRPHGISHTSFHGHSRDLQQQVKVTFFDFSVFGSIIRC